MGKAGRTPFCDASNPTAASPKVTNAAITTTTVFVASSARSRGPLKNRSQFPEAYTIRRKVGFFLKRQEIPLESLELAARLPEISSALGRESASTSTAP